MDETATRRWVRQQATGQGSLAHALVCEILEALKEATQAVNRSVLDGTISCRVCRALVLEQNQEAHEKWHYATALVMEPRR